MIKLLSTFVLLAVSANISASESYGIPAKNYANSSVLDVSGPKKSDNSYYFSRYTAHKDHQPYAHYAYKDSNWRDYSFSYHEKKTPSVDLFNLLMTGMAIGGAVYFAANGGGDSSKKASPPAPTRPPIVTPNPTPTTSLADATCGDNR